MIVGKYEEIYPPTLKDYVTVCDSAYDKEQILEQEAQVLLSLQFDLVRPTSFEFLNLFQQKIGMQELSFVFARYLLESSLVDIESIKYDSLTLAAGSIFLVNRIYKGVLNHDDFERVFQIPYQNIKECAKTIFYILDRTESEQLTAVKRKFGQKKYFEVSKNKIQRIQSK